MFRKKEDFVENVDSLIGEGIKVVGKIEGKGNIRIDRIIERDINYNGNIIIGETDKVFGNIKSGEISLAGTIKGNISSTSKLVLLETSTLIGDVEVPSFIIHENAQYEGNCKMLNSETCDMHLNKD